MVPRTCMLRSQTNVTQRLTCLLFTFLENLKKTGINYPVIIAGDFNHDIRYKYSTDYNVCEYNPKPLRNTIQRKNKVIDFIVISSGKFDKHNYVTAHDMKVPSKIDAEFITKASQGRGRTHTKLQRLYRLYRTITNHNPLSATLHLKRTNMQAHAIASKLSLQKKRRETTTTTTTTTTY